MGPNKGGPPAEASLRRCRRVLFGSFAPRKFEEVAPWQQFSAIPEDDDPVFCRIGGLAAANQFRRLAEQVQYADGYLHENALELLGMGISPRSQLGQQLFKVAQVQMVSPAPRGPYLTCYELLALNGVLRGGSDEELLELLYCVFDVDGDDRIGVADLSRSILAFMDFSAEEQQGLDAAEKKKQARLAQAIAEIALGKFGIIELDDFQALGTAVQPPPPPLPASAPPTETVAAVAAASSVEDSDDSGLDTLHQTKPAAGVAGQAKERPRRRFSCCLCGGKAPAKSLAEVPEKGVATAGKKVDTDSDPGSDVQALEAAITTAPGSASGGRKPKDRAQRTGCLGGCLRRGSASLGEGSDKEGKPIAPKPQRRGRCGLCRGKAPLDDGSPGAEARPLARRPRCSLCRGKPPAADSDDSGTKASPPAKSRRSLSLCRGKPPADDSDTARALAASDGEGSTSPSRSLRFAGQRMRSVGRSMSRQFPGQKKKPTMGYREWRHWLRASNFLPSSLSAAGLASLTGEVTAPPVDAVDNGAGVFTPTKSNRVEDSDSD